LDAADTVADTWMVHSINPVSTKGMIPESRSGREQGAHSGLEAAVEEEVKNLIREPLI
jgi:hypothetical protein